MYRTIEVVECLEASPLEGSSFARVASVSEDGEAARDANSTIDRSLLPGPCEVGRRFRVFVVPEPEFESAARMVATIDALVEAVSA